MPISAAIRPLVTVLGTVTFRRPFNRKADGELLGVNLNVETDGGPVRVTVWQSVETNPPGVGEVVAFNAEVQEDREGASLSYVGPVNADYLDRLVSASGLALSSK